MEALQKVKAGRQESYRLELESKQDEIATMQRETDRKRELAKALASQNAFAGAGGISSFEGSPLTVMEQDISLEKEDTSRDLFESRLRQRVRRLRGKEAKTQGLMGGISSGAEYSKRYAENR